MKRIKFRINFVEKAAMFMAGFTLYQCLRIALTASSFALNRFAIPRRNVDIFITKIHNSMEVAIFLGILIMTLYVILVPRKYSKYNKLVSIGTNWLVCILFFVVLYAYAFNGNEGYLNAYYWGLVLSGFAMGMNQSIVMAVSVQNISFFAGAIPLAGVQVSVYHIFFLYYGKQKPNFDVNYWILVYQIILAILISGTAAVLWNIAFIKDFVKVKRKTSLKEEDESSLKVLESLEEGKQIGDNIAMNPVIQMEVKESENEEIKVGMRGLKELMRKSKNMLKKTLEGTKNFTRRLSITTELSFWKSLCNAASPIMMSSVAMGLVYMMFPAVAPYRLTNLVTAHRIDVAILMTFVAPAILNIALCAFKIGPNCDWRVNKYWHFVWLFAIPYIICIVLFFMPIHYPEAKISELLTESKCVLTFTCFIFALSHAVLKTVGFTGAGVQNTWKPVEKPEITNVEINNLTDSLKEKDGQKSQKKKAKRGETKINVRNGQVSSFNILLSYFFLVIFAFIGDGYIKTVKVYERNRELWPTTDMGVVQSFGFWVSRSIRRGILSMGEVFTSNIRDQLMA